MKLRDSPRLHLVDRLSLWRLNQESCKMNAVSNPILKYLVYRLFEILEFVL